MRSLVARSCRLAGNTGGDCARLTYELSTTASTTTAPWHGCIADLQVRGRSRWRCHVSQIGDQHVSFGSPGNAVVVLGGMPMRKIASGGRGDPRIRMRTAQSSEPAKSRGQLTLTMRPYQCEPLLYAAHRRGVPTALMLIAIPAFFAPVVLVAAMQGTLSHAAGFEVAWDDLTRLARLGHRNTDSYFPLGSNVPSDHRIRLHLALQFVREWAVLRRGEIQADWERARRNEPLLGIDPLA